MNEYAKSDNYNKEMATHSVFFLGESQAQRSLVGYSPWGYKESDTIDQFTHIDTTAFQVATSKPTHSETSISQIHRSTL